MYEIRPWVTLVVFSAILCVFIRYQPHSLDKNTSMEIVAVVMSCLTFLEFKGNFILYLWQNNNVLSKIGSIWLVIFK